MDNAYRKLLEKQSYGFCGGHSAVKICEWTKKSLRGEGICYKEKFYGIIKSHRCCQMSPAINFCNMNCIFCWRERNNSPFGILDRPGKIIDAAIAAHRKLLYGFGGNPKVQAEKLSESLNPKHFAVSLSGEPLSYPKINALIRELHKRGLTSFIVTNGQFPGRLEKIEPPTQIYISVGAPDKKTFGMVNKPDMRNGWILLRKSLAVLKKLKARTRTVIRITLIKQLNMHSPEGYAKLIKLALPDFVEVKAYMCVGASRKNLAIRNMPLHNEVGEFAKKICRHCNYHLINEQSASRVVLLAKI